MRVLAQMPLLVILMAIASVVMYLPAAHALALGQFPVARAFFYSGTFLLIITGLVALATASGRWRDDSRNHLVALLAAYLVLPVMLALPFLLAVKDTSFLNSWFEMLSSFTTTGATLYDTPGRLPDTLHLWRALVGWLGGFYVLLMAVAVLAPLNLGGIEVLTGNAPGRGAPGAAQFGHGADASHRIARQAMVLFPAYGGLTLVLWALLALAGETGLVALCHAMATLSTSGISPVAGLSGSSSGLAGEGLIFLFLIFGVTRRALPGAALFDRDASVFRDPEVRMAMTIVGVVTLVLFLRHWLGAIELAEGQDLPGFLHALWGAAFTTLSFLTTTGFASTDWVSSRTWSGLGTPGMILLGLAIVGGGVATTAGGVKLLRVYALFRHGERELERLIHPNSVGGSGPAARRLRREGAYVAWVFFVLFALSIGLIMAALSLTGISFEPGLILALSALTTTGPLAQMAGETPISFADLDSSAKLILGFAMVLGRMETLAILALLAPGNWRR
ncbi:TrkH family potassium uptake protein [Rhodobacter ferrooxidans]|uniref:Cation transporter n=1 Tax=Rhodobacter ferrooxidans TaxID=371731 RepID=C8RZ27_9RHOB|nr:potassium transporter TrkG [Rhodobacter sp. SW2]EEW25984.1 cation transporter [Rhodobacter sp. SW2]